MKTSVDRQNNPDQKKGKILITKWCDRMLSMLIVDNRILTIQAQKQEKHAVGNIYVGKVQNIARNIGGAFVDLGEGYLTFLSLAEEKEAFVTNRTYDGKLRIGDELPVQIVREPMKTKLAGVTTRLSLTGDYVILGMPQGKEGLVQVSSKLSKKRQQHYRGMEELQRVAARHQVIVRTNADAAREDDALIAETAVLEAALDHVLQIADKRVCYSCLYRSEPEYVSFVRNSYLEEYDEIVTDQPEVCETLKERCPGDRLRFYQDEQLPLGKLYSIETRIKELLDKKVWLKSGGYLVIEPTEALISIDVNTGKYEKAGDKEETILRINKEAAEMVAQQLRARNLSGMILVDFINFKDKAHEQELLEYMNRLLKKDSVPARAVDMTELGLMELTRKKVLPCFAEQMRGE